MGWGRLGDPFERPAELVARDVDRGLVTLTGARRYGVVLRTDLTIDKTATTTLRTQLSKGRGECSLFNFGGTVEELKASSKADTGFEPPDEPRFAPWVEARLQQSAAPTKSAPQKRRPPTV